MKFNKKLIAAGFAAAAGLSLAPMASAQIEAVAPVGVSGEVDFIFNSFLFLISGMVGGRLLHAGSRHGAVQERRDDLCQEYCSLFYCRADVLPRRL